MLRSSSRANVFLPWQARFVVQATLRVDPRRIMSHSSVTLRVTLLEVRRDVQKNVGNGFGNRSNRLGRLR